MISRCWDVPVSVCVPMVAVISEGMVETGFGDAEGVWAMSHLVWVIKGLVWIEMSVVAHILVSVCVETVAVGDMQVFNPILTSVRE